MTTISVKPAAFIARATMSAAVDLTGATAVVGIVMPAAWTPAVVTIQGSPDGTTFYDLHSGTPGTELAFNVSPNSIVALDWNRLRSSKAVKLRSGTAAAPVIQNAACTFGIVVEGP